MALHPLWLNLVQSGLKVICLSRSIRHLQEASSTDGKGETADSREA